MKSNRIWALTAIVELLIANGAELNACDTFGGDSTALRAARKNGNTEIVKILERHGAREKPIIGGLLCRF